MALKSLRVTRKEINDYYSPKVSAYQRMINSINAGWYGQIIQRYLNTEILETYYNEYSYNLGQMVVYNATTGQEYIESEAGPAFWNVSSLEGLAFLNGTYEISGLRKLKYCNGCTDGNGLPFNTINNFQQRFTQLSSLVFGYGLYDGFLFYDLDQPRYTNVYPSVKVDDGVNMTYYFRTIDGIDQTLAKMSENTGQPEIAIEASITTAPLVKPQIGQNSVITSCCEGTSYIISGQQTIGTILYNDSLPESYCWYVESLTDLTPTLPPTITFTSGGRSCGFCTKTNGCPPSCEQISLSYSTNVNLVCSQSFSDYLIDWGTGKLYNFEDCGGTSPVSGYYYDGRSVLFWDGLSISDYGRCPSTSYFDLVDIFSDNFNGIWSYTNSPVQQIWSSGVNTFRFMYDSTYVQLSIRIISTYEPPTQGEVSNTPPKEYGFSYAGPGNTYTINLGYYLTIGCDANFLPSQTTTIPIEIQGNFGDKFNPDWRTIGTFNTTIIIPS